MVPGYFGGRMILIDGAAGKRSGLLKSKMVEIGANASSDFDKLVGKIGPMVPVYFIRMIFCFHRLDKPGQLATLRCGSIKNSGSKVKYKTSNIEMQRLEFCIKCSLNQ